MSPRFKLYLWLIICLTLIISGGSASVLKEALEEHLKDVAHNEGAESIKHDKQKGEKVHQLESQVNDSHKNQFSKANDEAKYLKKEHDTKSATETDAYKGHNTQQDKAEDSQSNGYKRGHKKGHHKQGFQNSYHKDESSNKSTFFDDFNDEGDQAAYNSKLNSHDNQGGRSYQGSHNNGKEYVRDNYRGGGYNRHGDSGTKQNAHQDYGKKYHLDDALNHNKFRNGHNSYDRGKVRDYHEYRAPEVHHHHYDPGHGDWQRWENRKGWEDESAWRPEPGWRNEPAWKNDGWRNEPGWQGEPGWNGDYGGPGYYDDYGVRHEGGYGYGPNHGYGYGYGESRAAPVAEIPKNVPMVAHRKQTITIYEDPRYDGKDKGQLRREEGDYLQLEFKPSNQRYASATYDDAYYSRNVPAREGGVESSKINRLVYNYRRQ